MIDFNTRMKNNNSMLIEPGDIINLSLDGTGGGQENCIDRIKYSGERATVYVGEEITTANIDTDWTITGFGTNVGGEDEIVLWVRPAAG